ncbi:hypothetical protein PLICRDRAFT_64476, partial [Plicaturopsis crispa FD-325 SS-3]
GVAALKGAYLWRMVDVVVKLTKNVRQQDDDWYSGFLSRLRTGRCTDRSALRRSNQAGKSDIDVLRERDFAHIWNTDPVEGRLFRDAPVIVGSTRLRDAINLQKAKKHSSRLGETLHYYHSIDTHRRKPLTGWVQQSVWNLSSSKTQSRLGKLPLFVGMKVIVTVNRAFSRGIVNGAEGVVTRIKYSLDSEYRRVAEVVYVCVPGAGQVADDLEVDVVPIFPVKTSITLKGDRRKGLSDRSFQRTYIPLLPAYCFTDYKAQGRSMERATVDICSARTLQGMYVMMSRVKTLKGVAILRWFPSASICGKRLSHQLRLELERIDHLDQLTKNAYMS